MDRELLKNANIFVFYAGLFGLIASFFLKDGLVAIGSLAVMVVTWIIHKKYFFKRKWR